MHVGRLGHRDHSPAHRPVSRRWSGRGRTTASYMDVHIRALLVLQASTIDAGYPRIEDSFPSYSADMHLLGFDLDSLIRSLTN